ncbi:MAG TPA: TROVE domain-containing protein [Acidimicrobiia bacterium]|nr:TROVE domain-containing protein [Acidimicrobiia bacterium]
MTKFSGTGKRPVQANLTAAVRTSRRRIVTHEGGTAYERDAESDLFLLAATNMVGEDTFYERAIDRDARFVDLVHRVTAGNPEFIAGDGAEKIGFAQYLRQHLGMRSAAVVMAAEYVAAGGGNGRSVIARALQRPDEPAELIGYWLAMHGRSLPMPVKRGVADAVRRLYTERAALRYDGLSRSIRMADVIELTHPSPKDARQSALFKHLLDRRHHNDAMPDPQALPMLAAAAALEAVPADDRRAVLRARGPQALAEAGFSWERLSGWLPGGLDAEAWEAVIPSMGVMASVRNLRNFDRAGIGEHAVETVIAKLTDQTEVAKARLFPYQVWAGYAFAPSDDWKRALGRTLDLTVANIPALDGTLVVIDTSGSMQSPVSNRSRLQRVEVAAVMAMATARRASAVDVVIYGEHNARVGNLAGRSVLGGVEHVVGLVGSVGHATYGHTAIARHFDPKRHRRVVLFTDDQQHDSGSVNLDHVPLIYTFNLAGYRPSALPAGQRGRYTLGGFTDATFETMKVLEGGANARWPF